MQSQELQKVVRAARKRLYPSLRNPHWLILRQRREIFRRWISDLPAAKLMILDVGGRLQPYQELLDGRIQRYISVDLRRTPVVDVIAAGESIPFAADSFDLILCTQVLEYVPEPKIVLAEIHRVLRPGGTLILSMPAAQPRDADEECWRFQPAGLKKLLAGYAGVEIVPEGGSITGFFRTINACADIFARYPAVRFVFSCTLFPAVNVLGLWLERLAGSSNDQFAVNYSSRARKVSGESKVPPASW
jgi:SAM-dependent methyltransferase